MAKVEGSNPFIRFNESPGDPGLSCVLSDWGALVICIGYHAWVPNCCLCRPRAGMRLGYGRRIYSWSSSITYAARDGKTRSPETWIRPLA
jgi:hypothetical protein